MQGALNILPTIHRLLAEQGVTFQFPSAGEYFFFLSIFAESQVYNFEMFLILEMHKIF